MLLISFSLKRFLHFSVVVFIAYLPFIQNPIDAGSLTKHLKESLSAAGSSFSSLFNPQKPPVSPIVFNRPALPPPALPAPPRPPPRVTRFSHPKALLRVELNPEIVAELLHQAKDANLIMKQPNHNKIDRKNAENGVHGNHADNNHSEIGDEFQPPLIAARLWVYSEGRMRKFPNRGVPIFPGVGDGSRVEFHFGDQWVDPRTGLFPEHRDNELEVAEWNALVVLWTSLHERWRQLTERGEPNREKPERTLFLELGIASADGGKIKPLFCVNVITAAQRPRNPGTTPFGPVLFEKRGGEMGNEILGVRVHIDAATDGGLKEPGGRGGKCPPYIEIAASQ